MIDHVNMIELSLVFDERIFLSSLPTATLGSHSGCRADASEAAIILLPSNITVFTLDFSGSGLSGGEHVTLGWNEVSTEKLSKAKLLSTDMMCH